MRKWTYLVAALLMSGATATFTSCIDTEEPAGIEQLRGAKAALIQAKADYQAALTAYRQVQVQQAEVDLQLKQVVLQIEQLKVAKQEAQNELDIADIDRQIANLAEQAKLDLLWYQTEIAKQQAELDKALIDLEYVVNTYRDDKYVKEITDAITALNQLRKNVTTAENTVRAKRAALLNAQASLGAAYRQGLVNDSLIIEKAIENQKFSLDQVKTLSGLSGQDLAAQLTEIEKQIAALDVQSAEIEKNIATAKSEIDPIEAEITEIENQYYVSDKVVTIPVEKVPAAIQEDFLKLFLESTNEVASGTTWAELASAPFYEENEMTADFVSVKTSLKKSFGSSSAWVELSDDVDNLVNFLKNHRNGNIEGYEVLFKKAYNSNFGVDLTYEEITPEHVKMGEMRKDEIASDAEKAAKIYNETDKVAWSTARDNFVTVAKAYGYTYNPYEDTSEKITAFQNLAADKQTDAEIKTVRDALVSYYTVRVPLDKPTLPSVTVGTETLTLDKALAKTEYTNAMLKTLLTTAPGNDIVTLLGKDIDLNDKGYDYSSLKGDVEDDGALQAFLRASETAFGTAWTLAAARVTEPTEDDYGVNVSGGSWYTYMELSRSYDIFSNMSSWIALTDYLEDEVAKGFEDAVADIVQQAAEKEQLIADKKDALYQLEVDNWAIIGSNSNWSSENPYTRPTVSKKEVLVILKGSVQSAIQTNTFTMYIYKVNVNGDGTYSSGSWQLVYNKTIEELENEINASMVDAMKALDIAKADIEAYDNGWAYDDDLNIQTLTQELADAEDALKDAQDQLALAETKLNNLLEAYAGSEETPAE